MQAYHFVFDLKRKEDKAFFQGGKKNLVVNVILIKRLGYAGIQEKYIECHIPC